MICPDEKGQSLLKVATRNAGLRHGTSAVAFAVAWAVAEQSLGHELGDGVLTNAMQEYRDYWRQSDRTTWRELERFREAFPGEKSPVRLLRLIEDERAMGTQKLGAAGFGGLRVAVG
jgi:hypothetical protein